MFSLFDGSRGNGIRLKIDKICDLMRLKHPSHTHAQLDLYMNGITVKKGNEKKNEYRR